MDVLGIFDCIHHPAAGGGGRHASRIPILDGFVCCILLLACALGSAASIGAPGGRESVDREVPEYKVKAAFLYNFVRFIEWPHHAFPAPESPLIVGIIGEDPFEGLLDKMLEGKSLDKRPFLVKRLRSSADSRECHIIFISASATGRLPLILNSIERSPILTVGEEAEFARQGGIINFVIVDGKVQFEINPRAAERAGLKISARLLSLARVVEDERRKENR